MRPAAQALVVMPVVLAAFVVGRHTGPPEGDPTSAFHSGRVDLSGPARVSYWRSGNGSPRQQCPERSELVPYRIQIDGREVFGGFDGAEQRAGDIWEIDLADGRVVIRAVHPPGP